MFEHLDDEVVDCQNYWWIGRK